MHNQLLRITPRVCALILAVAASLVGAGGANAQQLNVGGKTVEVHGFLSQGYAVSNDNNYLTMNTSKGTGALTDFGFNAQTQLTDKLRVGAQVYVRNVGALGNFRPEVDWAFADYRFKDWLGVRGGKVKTVLGLYNDSQDMEFLYTWALMPQSIYPTDVRGDNIAHVGADIYGRFRIKKAGAFAYTLWGGKRMNDPEGGYLYGLSTSSRVTNPDGSFKYVLSSTKTIDYYGGPVYGADLRWTTPVAGLVAGVSYIKADIETTGTYLKPTTIPYRMYTVSNPAKAVYAEYTRDALKLAAEFRHEDKLGVFNSPVGTAVPGDEDSRAWYVAAAYRFSKYLELGTYHSRFVANWRTNHADPMNHVYDQVVTGRIDVNNYITFKVEGHFIDGAMINSVLDRGFYAAPNPDGLKSTMRMLVVRVGVHM